MFTRIGIVSKLHEPSVKDAVEAVLQVLNRRGLEAYIDQQAAAEQPRGEYVVRDREVLPACCDLVISVGGDGTLLQCAGLIYPRNVALMGINLGRLGFLTDLRPADIHNGLNAVLDGAYLSEDRAVLGCEVYRNGQRIASDDGLNDIVIQKWNTARLITLNTYVDGKFLHAQRSDGIIVATPTGSTAYALAGGGPILDPSISALVLVPICPHTLTNRPIVVSDAATIEIEIATERDDASRVTCDGNAIEELLAGDRVRVFRREQSIRLLHPRDHNHFATLRAKLDWGRDPC